MAVKNLNSTDYKLKGKKYITDDVDNLETLDPELGNSAIVTEDKHIYIADGEEYVDFGVYNGGGDGVKDVTVNDTSVVNEEGVAEIDLTDYQEKLTDAQISNINRALVTPLTTPTEKIAIGVDASNSEVQYKFGEGITIVGDTSPYTITASGGSGGGVTDVEVDGTSVVDEDGVAEIDLSGKMDKVNPTGTGTITLGTRKTGSQGTDSVVIGKNNSGKGYESFSIGKDNNTTGYQAMSIGYGLSSTKDNVTLFGQYNEANFPSSIKLVVGTGTSTTRINSILIDQNGNTYVAGKLYSSSSSSVSSVTGNEVATKPSAVSSTGAITVTVADNTEYTYTTVTSLTMTGASVNCHGFITFGSSVGTISVTGFTASAGDDITTATANSVWEFDVAKGYILWKKWS